MQKPIALRVSGLAGAECHRVEINPLIGSALKAKSDSPAPALVVARRMVMLPDQGAGVIDACDVISVTDGDWSNAVLIVLPAGVPSGPSLPADAVGDARFLAHVERTAPHLFELAARTVAAIRSIGVDGKLEEAGGRWVNRPTNTFTLKAQPRAGNLQFTLYGNPSSYDVEGFLLQDQNSYSRGWVRGPEDALLFAKLARESHLRRTRS